MCSDKIARWCILGVQGGLLQQYLEEPLHISSLTVACLSSLAQQDTTQALSALKRAISGVHASIQHCLLPDPPPDRSAV